MSKPTLYSYFRSSASWRVRIALALKKVDYDYIVVNLVKDGGHQFQESYLQMNPLGQVPTLVIDGKTLTQSLPIIEYLEETIPEHPILPKDPLKRYQARQLAEIINSGIQPIQNLSVLKRLESFTGNPSDKAKWSESWITKGLEAFEKTLHQTSGKFCVGDEVTLADICLVPQLLNARRAGVNLLQFPKILEIEEECSKLECFRKAHPENQPDAFDASK